ncbi:polysaccharide deacetylase [Nitzschia inconspicua]|uniref:Polysaccharide deacetylase n=1 Tax=Nitzschia inconspicua TaxID=303405 RepID=A0A9K3LTU4_9STRA|nr:polysaccharide deacetylase [Nitzschia inconspicua]KAG7367884.1 polysaccharide deacetylase [Nitzschia inconspicua]
MELSSQFDGRCEPFMIYGVLRQTERSGEATSKGSTASVEWFVHIQDSSSIQQHHGDNRHSLDLSKDSYVVFDEKWNPLELHGKKSNLDTAIILYGAQQMKMGDGTELSKALLATKQRTSDSNTNDLEESDKNTDPTNRKENVLSVNGTSFGSFKLLPSISKRRESHLLSIFSNEKSVPVVSVPFHRSEIPLSMVKSQVEDGSLPMVPVKRSSTHQFLIQQSVDWFFHQETVRFFACQPYRFSPRTIYRFPGTVKSNTNGDDNSSLPRNSPSGYIALTIDDAPCRIDNRESSKLCQVLDLLGQYQAKATFMVIQQFLTHAHEPDLVRLLQEGNEMANHGVRDAAMSNTKDYPTVDVFVEAVQQCNARIQELQDHAMKHGDSSRHDPETIQSGVKWFRAPHGKYTKLMERGLERLDMYNVMCDAYAVDPVVEDAEWIAKSLSHQVKDGSIILIHMPEKGFREYCLHALRLLLEDLCVHKGFRVVTVSELERLSTAE